MEVFGNFGVWGGGERLFEGDESRTSRLMSELGCFQLEVWWFCTRHGLRKYRIVFSVGLGAAALKLQQVYTLTMEESLLRMQGHCEIKGQIDLL